MNDRWNPRLWLREWLKKDSRTEARERERFQAELAAFREGHGESTRPCAPVWSQLALGSDGRVTGSGHP